MGRSGPEMLRETRDLLNEPVAGFWTDAQLYRHITRAARYYIARMDRRSTNRVAMSDSISYGGGSAYINATVEAGHDFKIAIRRIEDISSDNPGPALEPAENFAEVREIQYSSAQYNSTNDTPYSWYAQYTVKEIDGSDAKILELYIAPIPAETKTLLVFYSVDGGGTSVTASTTDTNWQNALEQCVIYRAAVSASGQDKDYNRTSNLREELTEYERENDLYMVNLMGDDRVVFTGN